MKSTDVIMPVAFAATLFLVCGPALGKEPPTAPKLPYYDWGACPFECCTYRDWEAVEAVDAHKSRSSLSAVAFRIEKGDAVRGTTGVVITKRYGVTQILQPLQIGYNSTSQSPELSLDPGEVVYTLHYVGEGADLFWYKGKVYEGEISVPDDAEGTPPNAGSVKVLSRPEYEWWVKVENASGVVGWTKETTAFAHIDACE